MKKKIKIIGVPMDFGQLHRGVDMGPAALRYSGLVPRIRQLGYDVEDTGDVMVPVRDQGQAKSSSGDANYLQEIIEVCERVYEAGKKAISENAFPLFLGGDHSIAMGTIGGVSHNTQTGVIWIDAHGDFNTPKTSPSGNVHGMPLATLTGDGDPGLLEIGRKGKKIDPENVVLIGIRSLDDKEKERLKKSGVTVYTMRDIDEQGINTITNKALMKFVHMKRIHISLDMDAMDPVEAPGVGTPVPGGLTYREAHLFMEIIADSGKLSSMDMVEINPILDQANKTAELAVDLTVSALGKRIY
ncbi:Arginase [Desulfamplus magnetovallimortis]|uniref:Arginase n=1 Tax=Desulfamplus magnetovallimortis TaxID=1246637 RepID=A0A1W1HHH8_9BACT|nr:arginase [Desulfamplus magnetovallimortis]SLM31929.1 Arginase [Desulfamplus magnetovallimortis]